MKKWWESSTIWINLIGIIALALEFAIANEVTGDKEVISLLVAIANILNRFRAPVKIQKIEKSIT